MHKGKGILCKLSFSVYAWVSEWGQRVRAEWMTLHCQPWWMQPRNGYKEEEETHDRRTNINAWAQTKVLVSCRTRNAESPESFMRPRAWGAEGGTPLTLRWPPTPNCFIPQLDKKGPFANVGCSCDGGGENEKKNPVNCVFVLESRSKSLVRKKMWISRFGETRKGIGCSVTLWASLTHYPGSFITRFNNVGRGAACHCTRWVTAQWVMSPGKERQENCWI